MTYPSLKLTWLLPALVPLALASCGGDSSVDPARNTLAEGAWPTEALNGAAGPTKKKLFASIEARELSARPEDFRGEDFASRPRSPSPTRSAVALSSWSEVQQPFASLGASPPGAIPVTAVLHRGTVRDVTVGRVEAEEMAALVERLLGE